jgi:hypothetical protein
VKHNARGIAAEPATKARRAEVADGADSPTRGRETPEAARPKLYSLDGICWAIVPKSQAQNNGKSSINIPQSARNGQQISSISGSSIADDAAAQQINIAFAKPPKRQDKVQIKRREHENNTVS